MENHKKIEIVRFQNLLISERSLSFDYRSERPFFSFRAPTNCPCLQLRSPYTYAMAVSQTTNSKPITSPNKKEEVPSKKNLIQPHLLSDDVHSQKEEPPLPPQPPCYSSSKRTKCPGVRVIGGRIYDSENGKTCHQCRQKTMDFSAACKNRKNDKLCTIRFCHKCLLNRYGEKAEEMAVLDDWKCLKCRGICNCSCCMKKRGHQPTGILVHTAKATGFSSVSEMLHVTDPENSALEKTCKDVGASPNKQKTFKDVGASSNKEKAAGASTNKQTDSNKDLVATPTRTCGKGNSFEGKNNSNLSSILDGEVKKGESKRKKLRQNDNASKGGIAGSSLKKHKDFKDVGACPNKQTASNKEPVAAPERKHGKGNSFNEKKDLNLQPMSSISDDKGKKGKSKCKKLRQNDNAREGGIAGASLKKHKAFKDVGASPNKQIASKKEPVAAPARKHGNKKSFEGTNYSNLQPTLLTLDSEGNKIDNRIEERRWKKLRQKDNAGKGSTSGNTLLEMKSSKVSQICEGNSMKSIKKEEKISLSNNGCSKNLNSELEILENTSVDPRKKEGKKDERDSSLTDCDETGVPHGNMENATAKPKRVTKSQNVGKNTMTTYNSTVDIQLPLGANLTTVLGIDLAPEDVGHALQFLEFCAAFGQVFDLKKGQPEAILRELICGRSRRRIHRTQYSPNVRFHTQLLSLIQKDLGEESHLLGTTSSGKDSWLKALGKCISESHYALRDLPTGCFDRVGDSYDRLESSQKLRVLNFLCDETLGTVKLRDWIDEQNSKFVEREKEAKEKVLAAKDKEKCLKRKLQDDMAKAILLKNGAPLSISEHEKLVSRIKVEAVKAHAETLEAMGMVPKKKQRSDAVRTEPVLLDGDGSAYWKLGCYSSEPILLLQDIGNLDWVRSQEKWYTYDVEQTKVVEKYISCLRTKKLGKMAVPDILPLWSHESKT
ncbi:hypothetical protein NE237_005695 [Protea cynaroides]|uniref:DDT domain-containing protein n=1 Tax=Protea cynaroides TaxID=273540 RepID=A0A9Q0KL57_9MAGN|nr:hypothetical protein NE237_005695 [Protea cynaroides]